MFDKQFEKAWRRHPGVFLQRADDRGYGRSYDTVRNNMYDAARAMVISTLRETHGLPFGYCAPQFPLYEEMLEFYATELLAEFNTGICVPVLDIEAVKAVSFSYDDWF